MSEDDFRKSLSSISMQSWPATEHVWHLDEVEGKSSYFKSGIASSRRMVIVPRDCGA